MSDVKAGGAYVLVQARDELTKQLTAMEGRFKAFGAGIGSIGKKVAGVGAAMGAGFAVAVKHFADAGSQLVDISARTKVSVESLSALGYAAKQVGLDLGTVAIALKSMQKTLFSAAGGGKEALETLDDLGVSLGQLEGLDAEQKFIKLAEALGGIEDDTRQAGLAMKIFGKSGQMILPLAEDGATELKRLTKRARDLGLVMSKEDAAAADDLGDALDTLGAAVGRVANEVGGALAPTITDLTERILPSAKALGEWAKANQPIVQAAAASALAIAGLGTAMTLLEPTISAVGSIIGTLPVAFAVLANPVGAVTAALGLGAAAFLAFSEAGRETSARIGGAIADGFGDAASDIQTAMDAIAESLKRGRVQDAFEILFADLNVILAKGWARLRAGMFEGGVDIASNMVLDVVQAFENANKFIEDRILPRGFGRQDRTSAIDAIRQSLREMNAAQFDSAIENATDTPEIAGLEKKASDLRKKIANANAELDAATAATAGNRPESTPENRAFLERSVSLMSRFGPDLPQVQDMAEQIKGAFSTALSSRPLKEFAFRFQDTTGKDKGQFNFESITKGIGGLLGGASNEVARPLERIFEGAIDALGQVADANKTKDAAVGTFSGLIAEQLIGASGPEERTAKAAEATAKHTKRIADASRNGLAFT